MYNTISPARIKYNNMENLDAVRIQFSSRAALKEKFNLLGYGNVDFSARVKNLESFFVWENRKSPSKPPIPSLVIAGSGSLLHRKNSYENSSLLTILILDDLKTNELEKAIMREEVERSAYKAFSSLWKELCTRTEFLDEAEENDEGFKLLNMRVESSTLYSSQIILYPVKTEFNDTSNYSKELLVKSKNFK